MTTTYTLSSLPPLTALVGVEPATLLVGLDEDGPDGALKVYLGARYKRVHLLIEDEAEKDSFRRAWGSGGHVWVTPVPPPDLLYVDSASSDSDDNAQREQFEGSPDADWCGEPCSMRIDHDGPCR